MAPPLAVPPHLPREIIDLILTHFVHLPAHAQDPAYQWTTLRHVTRIHRRLLEKHFRTFWLPKLILTIYLSGVVSVDYRAWGLSKDGRTVRFRAREGWSDLCSRPRYELNDDDDEEAETLWAKTIWRGIMGGNLYEGSTSASVSGARMVWRLGVGEELLNDGYAGGWIVSDGFVQGIRTDAKGECVWFDWRGVFDVVLGDEMRMAKWTRKLLAKHIADLTASKKWPVYPRSQRLALLYHLRIDIQLRRRFITTAYHEHIFYQRPDPFTVPQDLLSEQFKPQVPQNEHLANPPTIMDVVIAEESMVFSMPGWRDLNFTEFAKLRAEEARWAFDAWTGNWAYRNDWDLYDTWDRSGTDAIFRWEDLIRRENIASIREEYRSAEEVMWRCKERQVMRDLKNCKRFAHGLVEDAHGVVVRCRDGFLCQECRLYQLA